MDRTAKEQAVSELNGVFSDAASVVVTHYSGLTVEQSTNLRVKMLEAGASFKVTKNRLACLALKGTQYESMADLFKGPTAIAWSNDPVAPAKVAVDFAKDNDKLIILGGGMGEKSLSEADVTALAKLPSLDELRAKLVGMLQTPATRVATVAQAPASQLARVFSAYAEKGEAA